MTAEIFLAALLGCLVAILVTCVFFKTVYMQSWLLFRQSQPIGNSGDFVSLGADDVCRAVPGVLDKAAFVSQRRRFDAEQDLLMAALDVSDDLRVEGGQSAEHLLAAVVAYRQATPARVARQLRAMAAFRKAQHVPDDPV
jgi:hypothetical protein